MAPIYYAVLVIGMLVGMINAEDPSLKIIMKNVRVKIEENPFFGNWEAQLDASGEQLSMKTPIKNDLPDNMRVNLKMTLDGNEVLDMDGTLCEGFNDELIGKDIAAHGLPKGTFPEKCPIKANKDLEIKDWRFSSHKIPSGTPEAPFNVILTYYEEGKDPIITIEGNGEVTH